MRITLKGDKMAYINEINTDDLNYFRNRIINRMRELNINSTRALAEKIVDTGIVTQTRPSGAIRTLKASTIDKTIQKHLSDQCGSNRLPDTLTAKHVQAYAYVLDCSVDYILGNTTATSKDICTRDLCNRTGLSEKAISRFLKMTDDTFAFRTLRISVDESREIINSLLLAPEFASLIKSLNEVSYHFRAEKNSPLDDLKKEIGHDRINVALEWDKRLDPLYKGPNPSESELQDVFLLREAIDKSCELHDRESSQKQFAKYQLMKSFQDVIDQLFPEN